VSGSELDDAELEFKLINEGREDSISVMEEIILILSHRIQDMEEE
jgi:hypothetical protein